MAIINLIFEIISYLKTIFKILDPDSSALAVTSKSMLHVVTEGTNDGKSQSSYSAFPAVSVATYLQHTAF